MSLNMMNMDGRFTLSVELSNRSIELLVFFAAGVMDPLVP